MTLTKEICDVQIAEARIWRKALIQAFGKRKYRDSTPAQRDKRISKRIYFTPSSPLAWEHILRIKWPGYHRNQWYGLYEVYFYESGDMDNSIVYRQWSEETDLQKIIDWAIDLEGPLAINLCMLGFTIGPWAPWVPPKRRKGPPRS